MSAAKHRITVQFDARLSYDLNLPGDDAALVRDQTPIRVLVERVRGGKDDSGGHTSVDGDGSVDAGRVAEIVSGCASYALILRVGEGDTARDYPQAEFVHRSAAEGAGQCLLQYLAGKSQLNVHPTLVSEPHGPPHKDHPHYVAVGWSMKKADPIASRGRGVVCGPKHLIEESEAPLIEQMAE